MSIEVRRKAGDAGHRSQGRSSRERTVVLNKEKSWCEEKSETEPRTGALLASGKAFSVGGRCRHQAVVGGKQVGSGGVETMCTDFPSEKAGCEGET